MVADGDHQIFTAEVDMRPIVKALVKARRAMGNADGEEIGRFAPWELFTEDIPKAARKIAKSKLVKSVYRGARGVIKSKVVGGILTAGAVAFPPVGVPAAAAYAGANALVGAVDRGKRAVRGARKVVRGANRYVKNKRRIARALKRKAASAAKKASRRAMSKLKKKLKKKMGRLKKLGSKARRKFLARLRKRAAAVKRKAKRKAMRRALNKLKRSPKLKRYIKRGKKLVKKAKALTKNRKVKKSLRKILKRYTKARDMIAQIQKVARHGKGLDKLQARKLARIIKVVGKNRVKLRTLKQAQKGGMLGMVINKRGILSAPQHFVERTRKKGVPNVLFSKGGEIMRGDFVPLKGKSLGGIKLPKVTVRKKRRKSRRKVSKKTRRNVVRLKRKLAKMSPAKKRRAMRAIARMLGRRRAKKARGRSSSRKRRSKSSRRRLTARR